MIEIPSWLAWQFRAVVAHSCQRREQSDPLPDVVLQADRHGLTLHAVHDRAAIGYVLAGPFPIARLRFPLAVLDGIDTGAGPLRLLAASGSRLHLFWNDGTANQRRECSAAVPLRSTAFPPRPDQSRSLPAGFLRAISDAMRTARQGSGAYALDQVQLRGQSGQIVASDGTQLLVQSGFPFAWEEDLLVSRRCLLDACPLPQDLAVQAGQSEGWVCLQVGPWSVHLRVSPPRPFPHLTDILPADAPRTIWQLSAGHARTLEQSLRSLSGSQTAWMRITIQFGASTKLQAGIPGVQESRTIVLEGCPVQGRPLVFSTSRCYLLRALELGFRTFGFTDEQAPVQATDASRLYLWMPLDSAGPEPPPRDTHLATG